MNRLMSRDAPNARWNRTLRNRLESACITHLPMLMHSTAGKKSFCRMHAIMSLSTTDYDEDIDAWQEGDQRHHADEAAIKMAGLRDEDMPLSVMIALQPRTRLRVLSCNEWITLWLQPGDVLFFRGDTCHYGVGYNHLNARVHCHLYSPTYKPSQPIAIHKCSSVSMPTVQEELVLQSADANAKQHNSGTPPTKPRSM